MWEAAAWTVLAGQLTALVGLVARLRWQAVRDGKRQDTLRELASELAAGSEVEIDDIRDDGSRLRVRVVAEAPARVEGR